ncbi:MAG TPA: hypothetical protein VLH41_03760 [Thermoanaerobaculia bacterium]|nr:hypothetical protein [Thermoanaerobaculia bacterium]
MTKDPGPSLADRLFSALMVDREWSVRESRGFVWWPHRFAQRVTAGEAFEDGGVAGCRVRVETDLLALDHSPTPALEATLGDLARHPPMAGVRVDEEGRKVTLVSSLFIHEALAPFFVPRLAVAAVLQATYAELGAETLARATGFPPAAETHPTSGARPHPDGLLRLAAERVLPAGDGPSRYADPGELRSSVDELRARGAKAVARPDGLNARFPFMASADDPLAPGISSLLEVRAGESHPELGRGVFLRLFLPGGSALLAGRPGTSVARRLNELELGDGRFACQTLGGWTLESSEPETDLPVAAGPPRLCHVTFLPNYVHVGGALRNAVLDAGLRALWAAHVFSHRRGVS